MDVKKSYKADLENQRAFNFLLGLVVVLSLFLAALEFTTDSGMSGISGDMLDDVAQDIEMIPLVSRDAAIAATTKGKTEGVTEKINVVDKPVENATDNHAPTANSQQSQLIGIAIGGVTDIGNTPLPPITAMKQDAPLSFHVVERLPEFPGGMSEFVQWLTKNLKYPATAQRQKKEGTVLVAFIINKDGTTADHKVVKSAYPELDREALRVLRMMPKWKPGEDGGAPCRTYFCIPIVFKL